MVIRNQPKIVKNKKTFNSQFGIVKWKIMRKKRSSRATLIRPKLIIRPFKCKESVEQTRKNVMVYNFQGNKRYWIIS